MSRSARDRRARSRLASDERPVVLVAAADLLAEVALLRLLAPDPRPREGRGPRQAGRRDRLRRQRRLVRLATDRALGLLLEVVLGHHCHLPREMWWLRG